jgi:hypothetical protein
VIDLEWLDEFDSSVEAELGEMLAEAAVEDEAAGFPQLSLDDPMVADLGARESSGGIADIAALPTVSDRDGAPGMSALDPVA